MPLTLDVVNAGELHLHSLLCGEAGADRVIPSCNGSPAAGGSPQVSTSAQTCELDSDSSRPKLYSQKANITDVSSGYGIV